jgi:hypothetical protein
MLGEFELQFRDTLRAKLPEAIRDQVQLASGATTQTGILLGLRAAEPMPSEMGSLRREIVPGADAPRRVVRLRCTLDCSFIPADEEQDRETLMAWLGLVLYALDDTDVREGRAFTGTAPDPGFLIHSTNITTLDSPFDIHATEPQRLKLSLSVDGWFWPVGEAGQAGIEIGEIRIRGVIHPVILSPADPGLVANGPAVDLSAKFETRGTSRITADELNNEAFGEVIARIEKEDGTAGDGTLSGGTAGDNGARILSVANDHVELTYTPPATAGSEFLILNIENNEGSRGIEIGRFRLVIRETT